MKVKKSEIQLLIAVIGILIAVCTYFLVYAKFNEKSDALESQNASLASQVATLQALDERKADYIAATDKMRNYITSFENRYPADILPEDSIMMIKTLEDMTRTTVASIAFGEGSEVVYAAAQSPDLHIPRTHIRPKSRIVQHGLPALQHLLLPGRVQHRQTVRRLVLRHLKGYPHALLKQVYQLPINAVQLLPQLPQLSHRLYPLILASVYPRFSPFPA